MELDLPKLYHTVQELGGLKEVIELDKWCRVADLMKIPKSAQDRVTKLDDIYCKYLLPYDTLSHDERQKLIAEVDKEWKQICKKGDTDDELYEDVNDCIAKGRSIALSAYYRVARNTVAMWFKEQQQQQQPSGGHSSSTSTAAAAVIRAEDVESLYWKNVQDRKNHICVLSGSIDSGAEGYGFPTTKTATFTKHPWNLKVLTNNPESVLKSLGPVMGMTVPTIHMGMVFSACCWYKDPHGLPWIEYLHTGADKVWYGVPSSQSDLFRAAMKRLLPRAVAEGQNHHTWLAADSGMVPPSRLLEHGVTLTRTVQKPGQFLIVMPRAYTCNVSTGYVISESVYFTQPGWLNGAEKIFQDLQKNCEPAAFSFEKLLINMSTDSRTPQNILKQLLNMLSNMRDCEVALRSQLVEDLGLKTSERIRPTTSKSNEHNDDYECDVCHSILYISMVNNSHEDCDYCLRHGIEILSKKHNQLKYCKFLYTFDETDLDMILVKLRERIDSKKKKTSTKS
jgi:protein Jumonji